MSMELIDVTTLQEFSAANEVRAILAAAQEILQEMQAIGTDEGVVGFKIYAEMLRKTIIQDIDPQDVEKQFNAPYGLGVPLNKGVEKEINVIQSYGLYYCREGEADKRLLQILTIPSFRRLARSKSLKEDIAFVLNQQLNEKRDVDKVTNKVMQHKFQTNF
ncbi:MAG: hypothetical protein ACOYK8_10125 [Alphaproteobacteria bacterium]